MDTREQFMASVGDGYEELAVGLAEYQADPDAHRRQYSWQVVNNPTGLYLELTKYGQATPESVRAYARQLQEEAGRLYDFAQTIPTMTWWQRQRCKIKNWMLIRWYNFRCRWAYNLGPGTIGPFHPAPQLCASQAYRDIQLKYTRARVQWRLARKFPLDVAIMK